MIITIDGPAGSGKTTVAGALAEKLGLAHLDTGATYRAVTLRALREKIDMEDSLALVEVARRAEIGFSSDGRVLLDGLDVSAEIRSGEVTENIHYLADSAQVRELMVSLQRRIGRELGGFVTEGRDQGSVVFPDADVKFFLTASAEVRARRRHKEILDSGGKVEYECLLEDIVRRDGYDLGRSVGPLVKPSGAVEIDTSGMSVREVIDKLLKGVEARG